MQGKSVYVGLLIFVLLDAAFIYLNNRWFSTQVIEVQRVTMIPKNIGILASYVVLCFAFWFFVLRTKRPILEAALLGFVINATFELTNYSIFKKWRETMVLVDTLWGGALYGLTTFLTFYFERSHIMDSFK